MFSWASFRSPSSFLLPLSRSIRSFFSCSREPSRSSTCCSSLVLALVRVLTLSSSACRSSSVCWWASGKALLLSCHLLSQVFNLVLGGMFLLLHFGQGKLKIINVLLQLRALIFQLPLLGCQLSIHLLLILQPLGSLFEFGLQLDLSLDETLASLLSIIQTFCFRCSCKSQVILLCCNSHQFLLQCLLLSCNLLMGGYQFCMFLLQFGQLLLCPSSLQERLDLEVHIHPWPCFHTDECADI